MKSSSRSSVLARHGSISTLGAIRIALFLGCTVFLAPRFVARAQEPAEGAPEEEEQQPSRWTNAIDFGLAVTQGNSNTESLKIDSKTEWKSECSSFRVDFGGHQTNTADDRFRLIDPGFTWLVGEDPPPEASSSLVTPEKEPDVEEFAFEIRYDRSISKNLQIRPGTTKWHAGVSWNRDISAGLLSRSSVFGGLGHTWLDREDLNFDTSYSLSYNKREEEAPDPEKEDEFAGLRLGWRYENGWGKQVIYENDFTSTLNLEDRGDYTASMTQSVRVPISDRLSLKVRLQWRYASEPAFEDIDTRALTVLIDPDGIPGSGDEFFETVASGGTAIDLGETRERKKELDTVFSTSLTVQLGGR